MKKVMIISVHTNAEFGQNSSTPHQASADYRTIKTRKINSTLKNEPKAQKTIMQCRDWQKLVSMFLPSKREELIL